MGKLTTQVFIERAIEKHGDKYNYSKVKYININTKVCIICPKHGEFWQIPKSHLKGYGCKKCAIEASSIKYAMTKGEFVEKAKKVHGEIYDYSKVNYINSQTKILIKCNKCGKEFWQTPNKHLMGRGCPSCNRGVKMSLKEFIEKADKVHNNKYDYSKVEFENGRDFITIICPKHGEFKQQANSHLSGHGCPICAIEKNSDKKRLSIEDFIEKAKKVHKDKYIYSKVDYKTAKDKVCIICPKHGEFWQEAFSHLQGHGCPICDAEINVSETKLYDFINSNLDCEVNREYKPSWLNGKSIDIYIPSLKIGIEYQGIQHFEPVDYFGGVKRFIKNCKNDKDKYKECKDNGVKLYYFSYLKKLPKHYIDNIYNDENKLLNEIKNNDYN